MEILFRLRWSELSPIQADVQNWTSRLQQTMTVATGSLLLILEDAAPMSKNVDSQMSVH